MNILKFRATNLSRDFGQTSIPTLGLNAPPTISLDPAWVERSYLAALNWARTAIWWWPKALCGPLRSLAPLLSLQGNPAQCPSVLLSYPYEGGHSVLWICPMTGLFNQVKLTKGQWTEE